MSSDDHSSYLSLYKLERLHKAIEKHLNDDLKSLPLKLKNFSARERSFISDQINGLRQIKKKFPHLNDRSGLVFPPKLNLEQSSSSQSATYKSGLLKGQKSVDLTAGFGIDSMHFSQSFDQVIAVEKETFLADILEHNRRCMGVENMIVVNMDAESFIQSMQDKVDLIYMDPSRRKKGERLRDLAQYSPDFLSMMPVLMKKCEHLLLKLSPLTDLSYLDNHIAFNKEIHVVSINNECKEILVHVSGQFSKSTVVHCTELSENTRQAYSFNLDEERQNKTNFSNALKYIYLPMTAIVKAGAFNSMARDFRLNKIAPNTHVYTSNVFEPKFPGQKFELVDVLKIDKKEFKPYADQGFVIHPRNTAMDVPGILKKLSIAEGQDLHLIVCKDINDRSVALVSRRINA